MPLKIIFFYLFVIKYFFHFRDFIRIQVMEKLVVNHAIINVTSVQMAIVALNVEIIDLDINVYARKDFLIME